MVDVESMDAVRNEVKVVAADDGSMLHIFIFFPDLILGIYLLFFRILLWGMYLHLSPKIV